MTGLRRDSAHSVAVEVYGDFLQECVIEKVGNDRVGTTNKVTRSRVDERPVRLITISGKGGWANDPKKTEEWAKYTNVSLLDHCLSVARGALVFYVTQAFDNTEIGDSPEEIKRLACALICIAFLHDIDKDLQLSRGTSISESLVNERMRRYGVDAFLASRRISISPAAMLNYIEQVEGTQAARSPAAVDYDRRIAVMSRYVEVADKLDGMFLDQDCGTEKLVSSLENLNHWPILRDKNLRLWDIIQIHDHLHVFLLDYFQLALSGACKEIAGRLPLIEIVHDGQLLCVIPRTQAPQIRKKALQDFVANLPFGLKFSVNNRLACEFVGGTATWEHCNKLMGETADWKKFQNLFALPRQFASDHVSKIDDLAYAADLKTSWSSLNEGAGSATVKPFLDHPEGSRECFGMDSVHALAFLVIVLNHSTKSGKRNAPNADTREKELLQRLEAVGRTPPAYICSELAQDHRARRVLLAIWVIADIWGHSFEDEAGAQKLFDEILGQQGLVGLWLEGNSSREGIQAQVTDNSSDITSALEQHFGRILAGKLLRQYDMDKASKHCFLCNVPTNSTRKVSTSLNVHGVKTSAFSGRDGRNDHLASPSRDTHLCLVCQAELKLRRRAQAEYKGGNDLPPLISSPATMGLFGGLVYERQQGYLSMGLNDLGRLQIAKGKVYRGLDVQTQRIRIARLESLPRRDEALVTEVCRVLKAIQRLGRPIHLFRGAPRQHPATFFMDTLPSWLERVLGGNSLRIEQIRQAISDLEFFDRVVKSPGLGTEWAKQIADPTNSISLGALCVVWSYALDRVNATNSKAQYNLLELRKEARQRALTIIKNTNNNGMQLKNNPDPLIRLAWLATRIQKRIGSGAATSKQLLCWRTALAFFSHAEGSITDDQTALILGLAATLEDNLNRGSSDAAASKYRDGQKLQEACIDFATHFATEVWTGVFGSKEPTSKDQRKAAAIYRFAFLEAYRERGISEVDGKLPANP
ncbi:MAG: hypothetical protein OXD43_03595 [Bacteroidetes bacterium]|nr:hypothetical protein [Bacteroidota bacterium]